MRESIFRRTGSDHTPSTRLRRPIGPPNESQEHSRSCIRRALSPEAATPAYRPARNLHDNPHNLLKRR